MDELVSAKPLRSGAVAMHYRRALTPSSPIAPQLAGQRFSVVAMALIYVVQKRRNR